MWNYIAPLRLFIHYLKKSGTPIQIELKDYPKVIKYSALYMALGRYDYLSGKDLYDFNVGEWPNWLINAGKPYMIYWEVKPR